MARVLVTGGTGFLGKALVPRLLARGDAVRLLVRHPGRHAALLEAWRVLGPVEVVTGELGGTLPEGLVAGVDHVVHLAGLYDLAASAEALEAVNVGGTRHLLQALASSGFSGVLHHASSIAVAGDHAGAFLESDLDVGQGFPHAYHRSKHAAEALVRTSGLRFRVWRPAAVVGHSRTGEADRADGPYHLFPLVKALRHALPGWVTVPGLLRGRMNLLPVDVVADVLAHLVHAEGLDGRTFHVVDPDPPEIGRTLGLLAEAAGGPRIGAPMGASLDRLLPGARDMIAGLGAVQGLRRAALDRLGIPLAVAEARNLDVRFDTTELTAALAGSSVVIPPQEAYLTALWDHWVRHLDPERSPALRADRVFAGRRVLITGASSGVGAALAVRAARHGATVILVARRAVELEEVAARCREAGGEAFVHPADLSDEAAVEALIRDVTAQHGGVDVLVNNAARSIRRSITASFDRPHDHERVMRLNYHTPVRLCLGFLPGMVARGHGHVVSVLTAGAHMPVPYFSAYGASKAALSAFTDTLAAELLHEGIGATSVFLPWVNTPMMTATPKYREKASAGDVWTPEQAADWIVEGLASGARHLKSGTTTRRFVLNQLAPGAMTRALSYVFRLYHEDRARFPELAVDRKLFKRLFPSDLM